MPHLRGLQLVLTAGCNLRCSYCYQSDKKDRRMEWDVARAALDRLLASAHDHVSVLFIGGEPLLEFPAIERAVAYLAEHKRPTMAIRHLVFTNGLLLGERELGFLIDRDFEVQVSFDGVPMVQQLRGANTFSRLDALLDRLRAQHPAFYHYRFRVNMTLVPATLPWLAESVEYFVRDKRIQDLSITPQITASPDWRPDRIAEMERAFQRIFDVCLERYEETGDVPLEIFRRSPGEAPARPAAISMCGVSSGEHLAVDVDGQGHGCLTFVESYQTFPTTFLRSRVEAMRLGDIRTPALEDRWKVFPAAVEAAGIFHHKEDKYSSYRRCGDCEFLASCSICPMSLGRMEGQEDARRIPDFNCAFNLVSLTYRSKFPVDRTLAERLLGPSERSMGSDPTVVL